jgi:alcohol dehydrogenase class IV
MDVAKTIALMVNHPGDVFDYEDGKPDALPVTEPIPYLAMVPTTAGTGSEVGRASVVSDDETKAKKIIFDPTLMPKVAILDPELLEKLPPSITATTGLDALCHLVEAYLAKGEHPMCDGIALEGIRIIKEALVECVGFAAKACGQEADYPQAIAVIQDDSRERHMRIRERMLQAAMMGAVAFQKGLGTTHSIAHALSTVNDLHHGLANGILMPHVMRYNAQEVPERFVTMAQAAGLDPTPESFINWLVELQTTLNVPGYLAPAGVTEDHLESIADYAFADGCHQSNPRDCTRDDLLAITRAALSA